MLQLPASRGEGQTAWIDPADGPEAPRPRWGQAVPGGLLAGAGRGSARGWQRGPGAGSGSVPRRSSWAQRVPAFTPRILLPARLIPAPAHSPWLPLSSAGGRGDFGEGGGERQCCCSEGQTLGSLGALLGDPRLHWALGPSQAGRSRAGWDGFRMDQGWFWDGFGTPWVPRAPLLHGHSSTAELARLGTARDAQRAPCRAAARAADPGRTHGL